LNSIKKFVMQMLHTLIFNCVELLSYTNLKLCTKLCLISIVISKKYIYIYYKLF
jgi:hypothetical protein